MATSVESVDDHVPRTVRPEPAWLSIPVFLALLALAKWLEPATSFEPRFLMPVLNTIFITGVSLLVAALAARSYVMGESIAVLLLGCGTLSFGAGSALTTASVLFDLPANTIVGVANLCAAIAGACFVASGAAVLVARQVAPTALLPRSRLVVTGCYGAVVALIALLIAASLDALLPPFFSMSAGEPTKARQLVLGASVAMFGLASVFFALLNRRTPSRFLHWYSLSLLLVLISFASFYNQRAVGSLVGWIGRAAQYAACTYMFVAVLSLPRGSRAWRISLNRTLRETEQRHQSLVDMCPDGIVVHAGGKYVFVNPAAARLFGARSPEQVIGRNVLDLIHPDFRGLVAERIQQAHEGRVTPLQEMQWLRLDGSAFDVEVTGARVEYGGKPAVQTVARDISKRKRAEGALRVQSTFATDLLKAPDKQALFDLLADRIYGVGGGAMVAVSEFDPRARKVTVRSVRCSAAEREVARAAFGRDPEGLALDFRDEVRTRWVDGSLASVPGGLPDLMFGQVPEALCDRLVRELNLGEMFGMACAYEADILGTVAILTRAGTGLPDRPLIESLVAAAALALKRARIDEERRQLERDLRASEGLLRSVTDHTTDAVYAKDRESRWLMANPALLRVVDRRSDEVLGLSDAEIYADPAIGRAILANDRLVLESGEPMTFEEAVEAATGTRWFLSTKAPMRDAAGRITGLIGISRDITERKRMEEALREADRRKDEFIATLSHELRNPLAPIRYALPLIRQERLGERGGHALDVVSRQIDHLVRLVDDLLDVSRITRGRIELRRTRVALDSVITRAVESASPTIEASGHALNVALPPDPIWLDIDPDRVSQIVTNLLTNAAKYTPPGGRIWLEASREDAHATIRVRDDGIGIAADAFPRLFEMFYRTKAPARSLPGVPAAADSQSGLGIGLALAKQLAELHGGAIEARSAGIGQGAEFTVRLPMAPPGQPARIEALASSPSAPARRLTVLIVDDNRDLVDMLSIIVDSLGHAVERATDGPAAIAAARRCRPDVVLLDLGLPGLDGLEVARELRRHPETSGARLVALTGLGQADDRRRTEEAGFDRHLTKPTEPEDLEQLLAQFAAERQPK